MRELTGDSEERACGCRPRERDADKAAYLEAFTSPQKPSKRKPRNPERQDKSHRTRSAITGYFGVRRESQGAQPGYRATINRKSRGTFETAEEAAHAYDGAALRDNIAHGYDKHQLNFCRAKAKALEVQHNTKALLGEDSSGTGRTTREMSKVLDAGG